MKTWSWHTYSYAFGFVLKTGCDRKWRSFINAKFAVKSQCKVATVPEVKVAGANGGDVYSETAHTPFRNKGIRQKKNTKEVAVWTDVVWIGR